VPASHKTRHGVFCFEMRTLPWENFQKSSHRLVESSWQARHVTQLETADDSNLQVIPLDAEAFVVCFPIQSHSWFWSNFSHRQNTKKVWKKRTRDYRRALLLSEQRRISSALKRRIEHSRDRNRPALVLFSQYAMCNSLQTLAYHSRDHVLVSVYEKYHGLTSKNW